MQTSAPGKIILFGEHAVVYGFPAVAAPVSSLRTYATIRPNPPGQTGLHIVLPAVIETTAVDRRALDESLALTVDKTLQTLSASEPDATIEITSDIPIASGLGSGAAAAAALARAIGMALDRVLDNETLNALVYEIERIHHGQPSGIDNTVVVYEQPIYFVRGQPIEPFRVGAPLHLIIADTGQSASTKVTVSAVRALYESDPERILPILQSIGDIAQRSRGLAAAGDVQQLGALMTANHALLKALSVSSDALDRLVEAAIRAGAYGAKLSGGGRGGNMIALTAAERLDDIRAALLDAGAVRVVSTIVH
jgi:mevalonate kinase